MITLVGGKKFDLPKKRKENMLLLRTQKDKTNIFTLIENNRFSDNIDFKDQLKLKNLTSKSKTLKKLFHLNMKDE